MFGKNKKTKNKSTKKNTIKKPIIHTMQDDLNINLEDPAVDNNIASSDSPFSDGSIDSKQEIEKKKIPGDSDVNAGEKSEMNSVSTSEGSPFINDKSLDPVTTATVPNLTPEPKSTSEVRPKTNISSKMPKSVDDLTTTVNKEEGNLRGNEKISETIQDSLSDKDSKPEKTEKKGRNGLFAFVSTIFVILFVGVAGYFVWDSNYKDVKDISSQDEDIQSNLFTEEPKIVVDNNKIDDNQNLSNFSEKTNFLVINSTDLNKNSLDSLINQKFLEMNDYEGVLLEFVLVDNNNNPIEFSEFSSAFEIGLDTNVTSQLGEDFYIYLYKNGATEKMGLVVKSVDVSSLGSALIKQEATLVGDVKSLLLGSVSEDKLSGNIFKDSIYGITEIRFTNLDDNSSVDYAIVADDMIIATSKDSGRAIIDRVLLEEADNISNAEGNEVNLGTDETKNIFNERIENESGNDGETLIEVE